MGKSYIWVGTLQTRMFKEYYCVLLIMDKLFNSWHITNTNTERILLGSKHNGLNCWTTNCKMDTFKYITLKVQVYQASTPEM